jgi:TonB family protein
MTVTVRVWVDSAGRVTRAILAGSSGRAELDSALKNEVLAGLQLQSPPPEGMPMPIVMRISAKRPN